MAGFGNMDFRGERKSERKLEKESEVNERQEDFHMENRYELNKQLSTDVKGRCDHGCYNTGAGEDCRGRRERVQ